MDNPAENREPQPSPEEIITQIRLLENERIRAATAAAAQEATANLKRSIAERELQKMAVQREYRRKIQEIEEFTCALRHHLVSRKESAGVTPQAEHLEESGGSIEEGNHEVNLSRGVDPPIGEEMVDEHLELDGAQKNGDLKSSDAQGSAPPPLFYPGQQIEFGVPSNRSVANARERTKLLKTRRTPGGNDQQDQPSSKKQKKQEVISETPKSSAWPFFSTPSWSSRKLRCGLSRMHTDLEGSQWIFNQQTQGQEEVIDDVDVEDADSGYVAGEAGLKF